MEQLLAKELNRMKIVDEQKKRQIQKIAAESDEIKELQAKIKSAMVNKERSAQITEVQYRKQMDLEKQTQIEMEMLRRKELADLQAQ